MMTPSVKILGFLGSALLLVGGAAAYTLLRDQLAVAATSQVACIDRSGRVVWVEGSCPTGAKQVPNACDAGFCVPCPPEGCPETVEALMCCPEICGEGSECFPIVETTAECPPGSVLYECDYGSSNADGSETCYIPPGS
jgi:hypothetical protein